MQAAEVLEAGEEGLLFLLGVDGEDLLGQTNSAVLLLPVRGHAWGWSRRRGAGGRLLHHDNIYRRHTKRRGQGQLHWKDSEKAASAQILFGVAAIQSYLLEQIGVSL